MSEIAAFVDRVYVHQNLKGFTGDPRLHPERLRQEDILQAAEFHRGTLCLAFEPTETAPPEYRPKSEAESQGLLKEADLAFRQAFALCPYSPEAVFRYVQLLLQLNRMDDALLVAQTCLKLDPDNGQVRVC